MELMSSTNDTYHHLLVQTQPKSILKKSSSPKLLDSSMDRENNLHVNSILSSTYETEKDDIDMNKINYYNNNNNHVCILNDNPSERKDNLYLSSIEVPLTKLVMTSHQNDNQFLRTVDSPLPSPSSDDEQQQQQRRTRLKLKKKYHRPFVTTSTFSSSSDNDERKAKRSMEESKTTLIRSNKHRQKDMQLDEFMRKYKQQGSIILLTKDDHDNEQITTQIPINHHQQGSRTRQSTSNISKESTNNDTMSLLESIDTITLSSISLAPLQLLLDVACRKQCDRRTKIERIRQYVEEQIGISAFLTMYKLIKSSQIPIDIQQKPFCYYAYLIPHLCCLIMLESEEQKNRLYEK